MDGVSSPHYVDFTIQAVVRFHHRTGYTASLTLLTRLGAARLTATRDPTVQHADRVAQNRTTKNPGEPFLISHVMTIVEERLCNLVLLAKKRYSRQLLISQAPTGPSSPNRSSRPTGLVE
jgi:hypothetical protein